MHACHKVGPLKPSHPLAYCRPMSRSPSLAVPPRCPSAAPPLVGVLVAEAFATPVPTSRHWPRPARAPAADRSTPSSHHGRATSSADHLAAGSRRARSAQRHVRAAGRRHAPRARPRSPSWWRTLQRERARAARPLVQTRLSEAIRPAPGLADTTQSPARGAGQPQGPGPVGRAHGRRRAARRRAGRGRQLPQAVGHRRRAPIPDFTFLLPGGRVLHMDVKFPVDNYLRYLEADSDAERDRYAIAVPARRAGPGEGAVGRAATSTPTTRSTRCCCSSPTRRSTPSSTSTTATCSTWRCGQKVVLCSPFTLFAVLAVIRQAVDQIQLAAHVRRDPRAASARFRQQWDKFSDALDTVGRSGSDSAAAGLRRPVRHPPPPARAPARPHRRPAAAAAAAHHRSPRSATVRARSSAARRAMCASYPAAVPSVTARGVRTARGSHRVRPHRRGRG